MKGKRAFGVVGSSWIYANKYEQILQTANKGKLRLLPSVRDIHDVTIRMHSALFEADVVLCENYDQTVDLLSSLHNKLQHIEPLPKHTQVVPMESPPTKNASEELLQLSEHLKFKQEYAKTAAQPLDLDRVVSEQNYIRMYNLKQGFRERIIDHKERHGYGYVISLERDPQLKLTDYISEGFNLSFIYDEAGRHLQQILLQAEQTKTPYEILPGPCELVTALAGSGFPADRFGVEYFPSSQSTETLNNLLEKRKNQTFSVGIMERRSSLERLLRRVSAIFGEAQLVYVLTGLFTVRRDVRQPAAECLNHFEKEPIPSKQQLEEPCIVVIAPYAMDYNDQLREKLFRRSQAIDEINEDEEVSTRRLKKLEETIRALQEPKHYKINGVDAAQYLLTIIPGEEQAAQLLKQLLRVGDREAERLITAARQLGNDVLQIDNKQLRRKK